MSQYISNPESLRKFIEEKPVHSIRLMFPNLDFNIAYPSILENEAIFKNDNDFSVPKS